MLRANLDTNQIIFAFASGSLPSAVAILRVAGPGVFDLTNQMFIPVNGVPLPKERGMFLGDILDPVTKERIDQVLVLSFVAPQSFSGEDTIEIQCHGSKAIVREIERVLSSLGARPASAGEFCYRALLNGKMSPYDVESLGDVFLAESRTDLQRIFSRKDRALEMRIARLRDRLVKLQAIFDTSVDFSEEYSNVVQAAHAPLTQAIQDCAEVTQSYERFSSGSTIPRLVLAGRPNAGKSSLFNALVGRYRAIVSDSPGTTRDVIEEDIEVGGTRWKIVDTAGVRESAKELERQGISLGADYLAASAFWVLLVDGTLGVSSAEENLLKQFGHLPHLVVWNKKDLPEWKPPLSSLVAESVVSLSVRNGVGMPDLLDRLSQILSRFGASAEVPLPTSIQCARLKRVGHSLRSLSECLAAGQPSEYLAEQNRTVLGELEGVIGEISPEDVLERIFGEFCIGK